MITHYLIRLHFDDGTTEDYHETSSRKEAERMVDSIEERSPEWSPRILETKAREA